MGNESTLISHEADCCAGTELANHICVASWCQAWATYLGASSESDSTDTSHLTIQGPAVYQTFMEGVSRLAHG